MSKRLLVISMVVLSVASTGLCDVLRSFSSLSDAEPWWELRSTTAEIEPNTYTLVRELPDMDSQLVDNFETLLRAETTFTNPKIDSQTYTGTFVNVAVELADQDIRAVTVRQTLLRVVSPTGANSGELATSLATLDYLKTRDNKILDLFSLSEGEGDRQALVFQNLNNTNETILMDTIADSDLVAQLAVGWTYADRKWREEENGSATFMVAFEKLGWGSFSINSPDYTYTNYPLSQVDGSYPVSILTRVYSRIHSTNFLAAIGAARSTAPSGYLIDSVEPFGGGGGYYSLRQVNSSVNTNISHSWSMPDGTYWVRVWAGTGDDRELLSSTRWDRMWTYTNRFFTTSEAAYDYIGVTNGPQYGGGVRQITPNAYSATIKVRDVSLDKASDI